MISDGEYLSQIRYVLIYKISSPKLQCRKRLSLLSPAAKSLPLSTNPLGSGSVKPSISTTNSSTKDGPSILSVPEEDTLHSIPPVCNKVWMKSAGNITQIPLSGTFSATPKNQLKSTLKITMLFTLPADMALFGTSTKTKNFIKLPEKSTKREESSLLSVTDLSPFATWSFPMANIWSKEKILPAFQTKRKQQLSWINTCLTCSRQLWCKEVVFSANKETGNLT